MKNRRIVYFIADINARNNGVFASQVFLQASYLVSLGAECLVIGSDSDPVAGAAFEARMREQYPVQCRIFPRQHGRIQLLSKYFFLLRVLMAARSTFSEFRPTHIYTRWCIPYWAVATARLILPGVVHVYDVRGLGYQETFLHRGKKDLFYLAMKLLEKLAARNAERLVCVSKGLGLWIEEECRRHDYELIPCCSPSPPAYPSQGDRVRLRGQFQFSEADLILCYNGGADAWQKIDVILGLFASLAEMNSRFKFVVLTNQVDIMRAEIEKAGLPPDRVLVLSCTNSEVFEIMPMCDAGVILRDDILLNNVASPIKVGEYLACGLPVILSEGIGDYSTTLPAAGVGLLLENNDIVRNAGKVEKFLTSLEGHKVRSNCLEFHRSHLHWSAYEARFLNLYR